jgi:hypothetical protein
MRLKPLPIALTVLLAVVICYVGGCVYFGIFGHSGTAMDKQALLKVYAAAGPDFAEVSSTSFLDKLKFTAPLQWRRAVWRPSLWVTSRIDVITFQRDMRDEPFVYLHPKDHSKAGSVYYFQILHRLKDDSVVMTEGTLDMPSGAFGIWSVPYESKTDDPSWHKLTNTTRIDFTFGTPNK